MWRIKIFLLLLCTSCGGPSNDQLKEEVTSIQGVAMTVPYRVEIGRPLSVHEEKKVQKCIESVFDRVNTIYNKWNPASDLSRINRASAYTPVKVPVELVVFLKRCGEFVQMSKGRFDPTIEPIQALWKKHLEAGTIPSQSDIEALRPAIGWHNLVIQGDTVMKKEGKTALDLGGIAKGFTVDLLIAELQSLGYKDLFVEWGGEVKAMGKHPQGRNWAVYITNLEDLDPDHAIAYIPLYNQAIATSGDYLQQWQVNGVTYFHIIDPQTLTPLTVTEDSIASASCLAKDCMTADVLATLLLMCPNLEQAKELATHLEKLYPNTAYWIASRKALKSNMPTSMLDAQLLSEYTPQIMQELEQEFAHQEDGRTTRDTREYGYSFFRLEKGDFTYREPPAFLQELGAHVCRALGHKPVEFTNIILSRYQKGFHLEPHVDVNEKDLYGTAPFYFEESVYGIIIEPDPTGHLYFVKWEGEGLRPPLDLKSIYDVDEKAGTVFCLQGDFRKTPYFHAVSPVSHQRISITFRRVVKI